MTGPDHQEALAHDLERLRSLEGMKWTRFGPDVLPAWVADMDLPPAPVAIEAMQPFLDRGDLGYNYDIVDEVAVAFCEWQFVQHGWQPDTERIRRFNTVLHGVELVLWQATKPGDGVLLLMPIYPPFQKAVTNTGRVIVECALDPIASSFSRDDLERALSEARAAGNAVTSILLSNPHNPTGRVFTRLELETLAECAEANDLLVLSDEVWADLVYDEEHHHLPFAQVSPQAAARTVTFSSSSKSFNLAGVRIGIAHFGSDAALAAVDALPVRLLGHTNVLDAAANIACWREGGPWLEGVLEHLTSQRDHLAERLARELPSLGFVKPEATYIAWLDCARLGLGPDPVPFLEERAKVALSAGITFGTQGAGFVRLNFATTRPVLDEIIDRVVAAIVTY